MSNLVDGHGHWARPAAPPVDSGGGGGDDGDMVKRLEKLEADVSAIKVDVAVIASNYATKSDIGELRIDMQKATTDIQRWMIATIIGLFVGFGGLFLAMSNAMKPGASAPATAPIVIYAQPAPQPAPPAAKAK